MSVPHAEVTLIAFAAWGLFGSKQKIRQFRELHPGSETGGPAACQSFHEMVSFGHRRWRRHRGRCSDLRPRDFAAGSELE